MKKAIVILGKIVRRLILSIIYLLLGVYIILLVPMFWGDTPLAVLTGSMEPTFNVGSIIYYEKINPTKFEKNDILVWENSSGEYISHRIVDINEKYEFTTKGDANNSVDSEKVLLEQVVGRAKEFKLPLLGHYVTFINKHLFVVYTLVGIVLFDYLISYIYYKVKSEEKNDIEDLKLTIEGNVGKINNGDDNQNCNDFFLTNKL